MASILDRYGIKEVADVTFYEIDSTGNAGAAVLYLDTLKVSTIEQTASTADATGGKGNPKLISWDYGKEISVTLEDALFSPKSLNIMFGKKGASLNKMSGSVLKTIQVRLGATGALPAYLTTEVYDANLGSASKNVSMDGTVDASNSEIAYANSGITLVGVFLEDGTEMKATGAAITTDTAWQAYTAEEANAGKKALVKFNIQALKSTIVVSGDSFPGTYYITGDTYARSDVDGKDQFFQFVIPKAKVTSENTITLEAEGDPSVFSMDLTVLRPESGEMMKLVQYGLEAPTVG